MNEEFIFTDEGQGYYALTNDAANRRIADYWRGSFTDKEVAEFNGTPEERAKKEAWFRQAVEFTPLPPRWA